MADTNEYAEKIVISEYTDNRGIACLCLCRIGENDIFHAYHAIIVIHGAASVIASAYLLARSENSDTESIRNILLRADNFVYRCFVVEYERHYHSFDRVFALSAASRRVSNVHDNGR